MSVAETGPTEMLEVTLPFEDSFQGALRSDWEILDGDWRIVNDQLTTVSREREWSHIVVGDKSWRDYTVEVDVSFRLVEQGVRVIVRAQDFENMMAFYTTYRYGNSGWWIKENGEWKVLAEGARVDRDVTIRVDVRGDLYTAYINGQRWLSVTDATFQKGRVGVGLFCESGANCNALDNFKVEPLRE